jgi:hypothetical protein
MSMKKTFFVVALVLACWAQAHAGLKTVGSGDTLRLDPSGFPPDMKLKYEIMQVRCIKCHTLERAIIAITTGIAPVSGQPFDKSSTKAYGIKMLRKPDSNMSKEDVKAVVELMNFLLDEAAR